MAINNFWKQAGDQPLVAWVEWIDEELRDALREAKVAQAHFMEAREAHDKAERDGNLETAADLERRLEDAASKLAVASERLNAAVDRRRMLGEALVDGDDPESFALAVELFRRDEESPFLIERLRKRNAPVDQLVALAEDRLLIRRAELDIDEEYSRPVFKAVASHPALASERPDVAMIAQGLYDSFGNELREEDWDLQSLLSDMLHLASWGGQMSDKQVAALVPILARGDFIDRPYDKAMVEDIDALWELIRPMHVVFTSGDWGRVLAAFLSRKDLPSTLRHELEAAQASRPSAPRD